MPDSRTYAATPRTLQNVQDMLQSHNVVVDSTQPTGEVKQEGWDISWSTPAADKITFTVNKHPFMEEGLMWSQLEQYLGKPL